MTAHDHLRVWRRRLLKRQANRPLEAASGEAFPESQGQSVKMRLRHRAANVPGNVAG